MHVICVFIDGLLKVTCVLFLYIHTKFVFKNVYEKKKIWFYNIIIYYITISSVAILYLSSFMGTNMLCEKKRSFQGTRKTF